MDKSKIIILVIGFIILAVIFSLEIGHNNSYIIPDAIVPVGFVATSANNTSLISEMNNGYWAGNESSGVNWTVYIYFYNVTHYDMVETTHRYFSTSGTPSNHEISRLIWCETHQDFMELEDYSNELNWFYNSKHIPDSSHFIMPNGTVIIKYDHPDNGNNAHRFWIDVVRLVKTENVII